jgi:hypothetical protein
MTGALRGALSRARPRSEIARSSFAIVLGRGCASPFMIVLRTCQEISESTFERIKYGFTTVSSYHMLWW